MINKNGITVFNNVDFGSVRVIAKDGEPWFVGKDVAEILGYSNSRKALSDHVDEEDKGVTKCDTLGGKQELVIINESGLYSLILGSKLPQAKKFKRWVTGEVLPQIRQTGGYIPVKEDDSDIEIMAKAFLIAQKTIEKKDQLLEEQRPKVEYHDKVLNSSKLITVTDIAKDLGMTANKLNKTLHEKGVQYKRGKKWLLYREFQHLIPQGYADYFINEYGQTLKWTEKGRKWLLGNVLNTI